MPTTPRDIALPVGAVALAGAFGVLVAVAGPKLAAIGLAIPFVAWAAFRIAIVIAGHPLRLIEGVAAFSLIIVSAPNVLPNSAFKVVALAPFVVALAFMDARRRVDRLSLYVLSAYVGLLVIALFRGASAEAWGSLASAVITGSTIVAVAAFGVKLFTSAADEADRRRRLMALAVAPGLFAVANIAAYAIGDRLPLIVIPQSTSIAAGTPASILNAIGFGGAVRVQLPLTGGVNAMGATAAVGIIVAGVMVRQTKGWVRIGHLSLGLACLVSAVLTDSRTAVLFAIFLLILALVTPRLKGAKGFALLLPLSPLITVAALGAFANSQLSQSLSRNGNDFATGTGRSFIWQAIWENTLSKVDPIHLIGYGANGQVTSGASPYYAFVFGNQEGTFTAHDVYLQMVLDIGYVGLAAMVAAAYLAFGRLRTAPGPGPALGWGIFAILLTGITESMPAPYALDVLTLFILLLAAESAVIGSWSAPPGAKHRAVQSDSHGESFARPPRAPMRD